MVVVSSHLDFNDHVNNLVYLQWALDLSRDHWLSEVDDEIASKYFWVVRKHEIEYFKQSRLGDELDLQTYVQHMRGPFSERVVQVHKQNELVVKVLTTWCFLEKQTQKLKRVPADVQALFQ